MTLWMLEIVAAGVGLATLCALLLQAMGVRAKAERPTLEGISRIASSMRTRQIGVP